MSRKPAASLHKHPVTMFPGFFIFFRKTIIWILVIFMLSFLPGKTLEKVKLFDISFQDLIVHFIMYGVFSVLLIKEWLFAEKMPQVKKAAWIIPLLATLILSLITETIQHFWIPGRYGSITDGLMNMMGSAAAVLICRIRGVRDRLIG